MAAARTTTVFHWVSRDPTGEQKIAPWLVFGDDGLQETQPVRYWPRVVRAAGINPGAEELVLRPARARAVLGAHAVTVHLANVRTTVPVPADWADVAREQGRTVLVVAYEPLNKATPIEELVQRLMESGRCVGAVLDLVEARL
ncbi:DUF5949 family protein [Streptomyces sp. NPDC059718]